LSAVQLRPGNRLKSVVCAAEVIVVRAPAGELDVTCGGEPMVALDAPAPPRRAAREGCDGGAVLGKRYVDDAAGLELLCTKAGAGALGLGQALLAMASTKPLPASD
jgi:hypothetical protein